MSRRLIDLVGRRFGQLKVICRAENGIRGETRWTCLCDCGCLTVVAGSNLNNKQSPTRACGRFHHGKTPKNKLNLEGRWFGKLFVLRSLGSDKNGKQIWECKCECGRISLLYTNTLTSGNSKSCGKCPRNLAVKPDHNLVGKIFGRYTVIRLIGSYKHRRFWECRCECGNIRTVATSDLISGHSKSCGCLKSDTTSLRNKQNLAGMQFDKLTVVNLYGMNKHHVQLWVCECECGQKTILSTNTLTSENTKSCGCLKRDMTAEKNRARPWNGIGDHSSFDKLKEEIQKEKRMLKMCR